MSTASPAASGAVRRRKPTAGELADRIVALETANRVLRADADRAAEQARFRLAELEHRLMNSFGVIQALAISTARPGDTGDGFRASFVPRLMALAGSHTLLCVERAADATLHEVVRGCLSPHDDGPGRITLAGPEVRLQALDVPALGLALHELATNASKHGALSVATGRIEATWRLAAGPQGQGRTVEILWRERGGPPVRPPTRRGFGSRLLEHGLGRRGSLVRLDFAPSGVECRIRLPLP